MSPNVSIFSIPFLEIIFFSNISLSFSTAEYLHQELMGKHFLHESCPPVSDLEIRRDASICLLNKFIQLQSVMMQSTRGSQHVCVNLVCLTYFSPLLACCLSVRKKQSAESVS